MVYLGLEPGAAGWYAQTNPLSYGCTASISFFLSLFIFLSVSLSYISLFVTLPSSILLFIFSLSLSQLLCFKTNLRIHV